MFLKTLSEVEKCAFLELAYRTAHADGEMAATEAEMLAYYRIETGLWEEDYAIQGVAIADAVAAFESDENRRAALLELMLVVMADGVAHPEEHAILTEITRHMGIDEDTADRLFAWVQKMSALVSSAKRLIATGGVLV